MALQASITNDLATLSKIPIKILLELYKRECLCIGSIIHDAILNNEEAVVVNIGIGTISVDIKTKQCKFTPGKELKTAI